MRAQRFNRYGLWMVNPACGAFAGAAGGARVESAAELSREGQGDGGGLPVGGWGAQVVVRRSHMQGKK